MNVSVHAYGKYKFKVLKKNTAKYFPDLGMNEVFIISLKQKRNHIKDIDPFNFFLCKIKKASWEKYFLLHPSVSISLFLCWQLGLDYTYTSPFLLVLF